MINYMYDSLPLLTFCMIFFFSKSDIANLLILIIITVEYLYVSIQHCDMFIVVLTLILVFINLELRRI